MTAGAAIGFLNYTYSDGGASPGAGAGNAIGFLYYTYSGGGSVTPPPPPTPTPTPPPPPHHPRKRIPHYGFLDYPYRRFPRNR
jgi:hypothetical protein